MVVLIAGLASLRSLPIEKFPDLSPPVVVVSATYPGASAEVVEKTVTALLEQEINGVPGMSYIDSVSAGNGRAKIRVVFEIGSDVDQKSVLVQNRIQKAVPRLPPAVKREGVVVEAAASGMLAVVSLYADDPEKHDALFLSNYALLNLKDALARGEGIGQVEMLGAREYGVRVWLDPDRLREFNLAPKEVTQAIVAQNVQLAGGRIGAAPTAQDQRYEFAVLMPGRLASAEEFGQVIIRQGEDGSVLRVEDVAEVKLGAQNYDVTSKLNNAPAASLVAYQLPGSNALSAVEGIRAEMERLEGSFPEGVNWTISYDSTRSVAASIEEMKATLMISVGLVILVVFIFLGGVRPTIVPAVAVPVSLIGTMALISAFGFSLNTLSLFGIILAIGVVVDDAILVVETSTRNIEEHGMQPKQAAIEAMKEVGGAVIASTLVLLAVFVPVAFIPGLTGRLFQQFALTISAAVCISTLNALTLSPALSSLILPRPGAKPTRMAKAFNRLFEPLRKYYVGVVRVTLVRKALVPLVVLAVVAATGMLSRSIPSGFLPVEDDGILMVQVSLPDAASGNRTDAALAAVVALAREEAEVADVVSFSGYDLLSGSVSPNKGLAILVLKDWADRADPQQSLAAVKARIDAKASELVEASVFSFQPPSIPGLGMTAGVDFELQNRGGLDATTLSEVSAEFAAAVAQQPAVARTVTSFTADVPQARVELDRERIARMGIPMSNIQDTLSGNLASSYVDDFVLFGRTFRVMASGEQGRISTPQDLLDLTTRTRDNALVPLGTVADVHLVGGPSFITRFNLYPNARVTMVPAPGYSSEDAMLAAEGVAAAMLGPEFGYEWSGQAREQRTASGSTSVVFVLSIVLVFLFLTAQYESFTTPISVLLMVPMAVFGAFLAQAVAGLPIDLYTQVGLVLLVGLTAKTAILLVELAKQQVDAGKDPTEAVEAAAHLRFRAVLMTAGTFVLGMLPMLTASGAGAASRVSLGTAVTGGTIAGIFFTLLLVPRLYSMIYTLVRRVMPGGIPPEAGPD